MLGYFSLAMLCKVGYASGAYLPSVLNGARYAMAYCTGIKNKEMRMNNIYKKKDHFYIPNRFFSPMLIRI